MLKESIVEEAKIAKSKKKVLKEDAAQEVIGYILGMSGVGVTSAMIMAAWKKLQSKNPELFRELQKINTTAHGGKKIPSNDINEAKKKPSAGLSKKKKSEIVKKAKKGEDIGKKGKGFEKVAKKAAKEYGSEEAGKRVAAASMWKNIKRKK